MDAFDAIELDVACGARSADPGEWAQWIEELYGVGYGGDDLVGSYDDEVVVGDKCL